MFIDRRGLLFGLPAPVGGRVGLVYSFSEPSSDQMEEEKRCQCLLRLRACRRGAMAFHRSASFGCPRHTRDGTGRHSKVGLD